MQEQIDKERNKIIDSKKKIKELNNVNKFIEKLNYTSHNDIIHIFIIWLLKQDETKFLSSVLEPSSLNQSNNSGGQGKKYYLYDVLRSNEYQKLDVFKCILIQNKEKSKNCSYYIDLLDILINKYRREWSEKSYEKTELEKIIFKILDSNLKKRLHTENNVYTKKKRSRY